MDKKSLCFMNLKGGVGKSTLAVAFAEYLAFARTQRVLFIDGDPQCNSTVMLVGPQRAKNLEKNRKTFYDLVRGILVRGKEMSLEDFIESSASNIASSHGGSISLLPSSIRFADYESMLFNFAEDNEFTIESVHRRASRAIDRLERETTESYDWVIVDSPPSFGFQARLVMRLARHAVIPTTPDPLAAHGTNYVIYRLNRHQLRTDPLCVVISKYRKQSPLAVQYAESIKLRKDPPVEEAWPFVLNTFVPEAAALQKVADFNAFEEKPSSFIKKYGDKAGIVAMMSDEIIDLVGRSPS